MESDSAKTSPFSSPNAGVLLKNRVLAWSKETGSPTRACVRVNGRIFNLHESPMRSKSGYFQKAMIEGFDIELPEEFPGGSESFEMVALFSYESPLPIDPFNVAALRCAAEFLEMTEMYCSANLCERSDLYLNQVVLQNWDDTLIVLQKCQPLLPWSEELLIVSRCVESLAFMACMEILDPEDKRDWPIVTTLEALASWDCEKVKGIAGQDLWIKDLMALPFEFFERIIGSMRRQGMREKYVSPVTMFYANKWVLSKKTHKFWENTAEEDGSANADNKVSVILEGVIELLPVRDKACRVLPAAFYFALLSRSLTLSLSIESRIKLEDQVAALLQCARVEHFLLPEKNVENVASSAEVETMERIMSRYVSSKEETNSSGCTPLINNAVVAELWDAYLVKIAIDPKLGPIRFMELIETVPIEDRETHDHLYYAMNTFLSKHSALSIEEKSSVCKYLNCQKLSQEACIQAVQNEQMPLRLIVQALFIQQLQTHQAFRECSDSFRYIESRDFSGSISSSRCQLQKSPTVEDRPYKPKTKEGETPGMSLCSLLRHDIAVHKSELAKAEYESTSFRIQVLEEELTSLKQILQWQNTRKEPDQITPETLSFRMFDSEDGTVVKKRNPIYQIGSCISSVSWTSQRKCARRLLKAIRRIAMLGKGKSKIKQAVSGFSNGANACRSKPLHEVYDC
ncbi:putative BTB/POZ domain, NPH3 domain, NPH3/RPT2-like family protein [Dioscorea sansibarensis]